MDIIDRLDNEEMFVDAIDDAIAEIKALRADNAALEQKLARALEGVRKYLQTGAWDHLMDLLPEEKGWRER